MDKVTHILIFAVILAAAILGLMYALDATKVPEYSNNPKDWLDVDNDLTSVNMEHATKGKSEFDGKAQQYDDGIIKTAFDMEGIYKGNGFFAEKYYEQIDEKYIVKMELTTELNSTDGIPQGVMLERFEDGKPIVYIFVDEDWKREFPMLNIVWGKEFQNTRPFRFTPTGKSTYYDKVADDKNRFTNPYYDDITYGGVILTDATQNDILEGSTDMTLMRLN